MHHRRASTAAALAVALVVTTVLPWASSGRRVRNSYELIDVADRAGIVPGWAAPLALAWVLIPLVAGIAVLLLASGRVRLGAAVLVTLGLLVGTGGVLVHRSTLDAEQGARAASALAAITVLTGARLILGRQRREPR